MILAGIADRIARLVATRLDAMIERRIQQYRADIAEEAPRLALARVAADYGKRLEAVENELRISEQHPDRTPQQLRLMLKAAISDIRVIRHHMLGTASDAARGK